MIFVMRFIIQNNRRACYFSAIGICTCFGDPHCISYDQKILHFQGDCQYVMSQDGCDGSPQTFQVLTKHTNRNLPGVTDATWIEKVTVKSPHYVSSIVKHALVTTCIKQTCIM
jgi:hypothetical protein